MSQIFAKALCFLTMFVGLHSNVYSQEAGDKKLLEATIQRVIDTARGRIGVGIMALDSDDELIINNDHHYPMQSVFKFPIALAVLHEVDASVLHLNHIIDIPRASLDSNTWSPMLKDYRNLDIRISLAELLSYAISKSDNNAANILIKLAGGPGKVTDYLRTLHITNITITATEAEMRMNWSVQYTNWSQPQAMLQLLKKFFRGEILSKTNSHFLMKAMTESANPDDRIKGLLPPHTVVAHKTGTSDTRHGITAATNDIGIITLPNGRHYAIVVYISDFRGGPKRGSDMIAAISKAAWDYFTDAR